METSLCFYYIKQVFHVIFYFCFLWYFTFAFCGILLLLFVAFYFCFLWCCQTYPCYERREREMGSWFKSSKGSKVEGFGFVEKYLGKNLEGMNKGVTFAKKEWMMTYLNQFHKEAVERKLRKIAESMKSPMNSFDAANYMKRNFEMAKSM